MIMTTVNAEPMNHVDIVDNVCMASDTWPASAKPWRGSSQLPKFFFKRHVVVQNVEIHSKEIVSVRAWGQCNRNGRSIWSRNRLVLPFKCAQMSITARILVGNACEWTNGRLSLASYLALTISPTRHVGIRNEYAYWTCNEHGQELLSCNIPLQQN